MTGRRIFFRSGSEENDDMPLLNDYSEEAREILGRLPRWIIRSGVTVLFAVFVSIIAISYFIKWPDLITAPLVITAQNPPVELEAGSAGKIDRFLVKEGEPVAVRQDIVVLYNEASYDDVATLEKLLKAHNEESPLYYSETFVGAGYELGEVNASYLALQRNCKLYRYYLDTRQTERKKRLLQDQIDRARDNLTLQRRQFELSMRDKVYDEKNYSRDSLLFTKYQTITEVDLERSERTVLNKEISLMGQRSALNTSEVALVALEEELADLDIQDERDRNQFLMQIAEARNTVLSQVEQWRERYVITAPIAGRATFLNYWSENQAVAPGTRFGSVIPDEPASVVGRAVIPAEGIARIAVGQTVDVKLDAFPFMEYGVLKGTVRSVSEVPDESGFQAEIVFPEGLTSSFGKQIGYIYQMGGTAGIVTKDVRLIERFFRPLRSAVSENLAQ